MVSHVYVRPERCMGCRSCEFACAVQHSKGKDLLSALSETPRPRKRLFVEEADGFRMPVVCRHCEEAPCMRACISGCLYKDEKGFVRRRKERCIGCWSCIMACPFGVITKDPEGKIAVKCDRCHKLEVPACVNACPTKALVLVEVEELPKQKRQALMLKAVQEVV